MRRRHLREAHRSTMLAALLLPAACALTLPPLGARSIAREVALNEARHAADLARSAATWGPPLVVGDCAGDAEPWRCDYASAPRLDARGPALQPKPGHARPGGPARACPPTRGEPVGVGPMLATLVLRDAALTHGFVYFADLAPRSERSVQPDSLKSSSM